MLVGALLPITYRMEVPSRAGVVDFARQLPLHLPATRMRISGVAEKSLSFQCGWVFDLPALAAQLPLRIWVALAVGFLHLWRAVRFVSQEESRI